MYGASIVIGYDGSPGAQAALRWGVDAAVRHRVPVRLVYAEPGARRVKPPAEHQRLPAEAIIARAVEQARMLCSGQVAVTGVVVDGAAAPVLSAQSEQARMLVLGSRGRGVLAGLLAGSVSVAVAAHAHCPVVVVREGHRPGVPGRSVVAAVNENPAALDFALAEAAARVVDLVAVRVWNPSAQWERGDWDDSARETAERHALEASLRGWPEKYPSVPVTGRLIAGDTGRTLADASEGAQLIVVGSRGSVRQYLLRHASCPVAVVPG